MKNSIAIAAAAVALSGFPNAQAPSADYVVSTEWLAGKLNDPSVVIVATGERTLFGRGHIPGARFIDHMETLGGDHRLAASEALAAALAKAGGRDDARVVLYGEAPMATGWLYMAFASIGHGDHVSMLDGNFEAWRAEGWPTSTTVAPEARGRLTPKPAPDVIVDAAWVKSHLQTPATRILDVRSEGERAEGFIPGSTLILWQSLFRDVNTARFKSKDEIRALLAAAGLTPGQEAVTYCAIGMRASLMYFAAKYAGVPARVYVGSWQDWIRNGKGQSEDWPLQ
jgi:thiosulfate/3-mercaptopyruvate sulfurtransferase